MNSELNPSQGYAIFAKVEEGEDDNAAANGYAKKYFDDFFNSNEVEEEDDNVAANDYAKKYFDDFFNPSKVEEEDDNAADDYVKSYVDDFFNSKMQDTPTHVVREPVSITKG